MRLRALRLILFAFGYPVAIGVIVRWIPVVRERRIKWFLWHEVAVAAIVLGHATRGEKGRAGVIINGAWLVIAAAWYWVGGRRLARD